MLNTLFTHLGAAAHLTKGCDPSFLGLKSWYYYLNVDSACNITDFNFLPSSGKSDVLLIGLVLVDDLLRIAGLVAIGFVIYGGILYVTSQGSPEQTAKAQNTIQNALIGLLIATISIAVVSYLGGQLG